jgi:hypothetical protein
MRYAKGKLATSRKSRFIYEVKYYCIQTNQPFQKSHSFHPQPMLPQHLNALRVVIILDLAGRARSARSRTGESLSTTLTPLSSGSTRARSSRGSRSSSSRSLNNSRQSGSRLGSNRGSSRSANRHLGGNNSRGGRLGGNSRSGRLGGNGCGTTSATADNGRAGSLVRGVDGRVVDVGKDASVSGRVTAGKRDLSRCGGRERTRTGNLDLSARLVELGATGGGGGVQSEKLNAHEVLARSDAAGHGELLPAEASGVGVLDHVVSVTGDLEPLKASGRGRDGIIDLGKVDLGRTLVRRGDRVVRVASTLRATETVSPSTSDGRTGGDGDELGRRTRAGTAEKVGGADILDGVVGGRGTNTGQGALVNTIDHDTLHDGMGVDWGGKSQSGDERVLHCCGCRYRIEYVIPARGVELKSSVIERESGLEKTVVVEKNVEGKSDAWEESKVQDQTLPYISNQGLCSFHLRAKTRYPTHALTSSRQ